mmetsp:Transcript_8334/g.15551  ORF Transcript_8334/g.15551 Transcript_8334/m.15551 type:complete len:82 (+) Transcript_8334:41-286(+)
MGRRSCLCKSFTPSWQKHSTGENWHRRPGDNAYNCKLHFVLSKEDQHCESLPFSPGRIPRITLRYEDSGAKGMEGESGGLH